MSVEPDDEPFRPITALTIVVAAALAAAGLYALYRLGAAGGML